MDGKAHDVVEGTADSADGGQAEPFLHAVCSSLVVRAVVVYVVFFFRLRQFFDVDFGVEYVFFDFSAVLAFLMMHDASGIRMESGKQAKAINDLHEHLKTLIKTPAEERLEEFLGHTHLQVLMGALLGIAVALIVHQL